MPCTRAVDSGNNKFGDTLFPALRPLNVDSDYLSMHHNGIEVPVSTERCRDVFVAGEHDEELFEFAGDSLLKSAKR